MTMRKRPNSAGPRRAEQPETSAGTDTSGPRSTRPDQLDETLWPTADRGPAMSDPAGGGPTAGTTEVDVKGPSGAYRVDFASVLDHDALVDLRGDETDYDRFEDARDHAVDVLEGVLDQLTHLVGQLKEA